MQTQGLWQDVRELKTSLKEVMNQADLSAQIKPRDEFTHHNSDSRRLIKTARDKLKRLPTNNPQYNQLLIMTASVLSSAGALAEAEQSLLEARKLAETDADRALAAFNLFQVRLRNGDFETALTDLQTAIAIDSHRYALHDIDRYPIERILGAGGMGVVFLCRHKLQKQRRVVKCFWEHRKGPAEKVFKEAFAMTEIAGQFVPEPIDYGYIDPIKQERAYFVTEYIEGTIDGETWLAQHNPLNLAEGLEVGLQMATALQAAHQKGILHLDLKPANILLKRTQTGLAVKIIDFGLAQVATSLQQEVVKQQRTQTHLSVLGKAVFGTLDYACPEQQGFEQYGKPSVQCDVFAFGKTLYRLLTGKHPRHNLRQRDLPNVPPLYELLEDCVEEEPQYRPKSALELIERLTGIGEVLETVQQNEEAKEETEKERQVEIARPKQLAEEADEKAWQTACQNNTTFAYQMYLNGDTIKKYADKAKQSLQNIENERQAKLRRVEQAKKEQARKRREKQEAETEKKQQAKMAAIDTKEELQTMFEQTELAKRKADIEKRRQAELKEAERKQQARLEEELEEEDKQAWQLAHQINSIAAYQTYLNGNTLKQFANEAKKQLRFTKKVEKMKQLSALNPLDYLSLLWWILVMPQQLIAYRKKFGRDEYWVLGKLLVNRLVPKLLFIYLIE